MKIIIFNIILLQSLLAVSCNSKKNTYKYTSDEEVKSIKLGDTITFLRDKVIGSKKATSINENFDESKVILLEDSEIAEPFMSFSNNLEEGISLKLFLEKLFFLDDSLLKIKLNGNNVDLFFLANNSVNFYDEIIGDSSQWVFNHYRYHDIYFSLFSFEKVNTIRVFIESNLDEVEEVASVSKDKNITFLPLTGDYDIKLPNGTMNKKWYREKTNYWSFFKGPILDNKSTFNRNSEIKKAVLDSVFN